MTEAALTASPAALELIERLRAGHGPLALHISGGCCDGSSPMCLREADMSPGPHDLRLGELAGAPVYMDSDQYRRWNRPALRLDVAPGPSMGFSLDSLSEEHLVIR